MIKRKIRNKPLLIFFLALDCYRNLSSPDWMDTELLDGWV